MDRFPVELWTQIFQYACIDEGLTGRSLSGVSKFIRSASAPMKYQSICIANAVQMKAFSDLLSSDRWSPSQPVCRLLLILDDNSYLTSEELVSEFLRLLNLVHNQLQIFCLYATRMITYPRSERRSIHFPSLTDLCIISDIPDPLYAISDVHFDAHLPSFPRLQRASLRFGSVTYKRLFHTLVSSAPNLTQLDVNQCSIVQESDLLQALKLFFDIHIMEQARGRRDGSPPNTPSINLQLMEEPSTSWSGLSWLHGRCALEQMSSNDRRLKVVLHRPVVKASTIRRAWVNGEHRFW